MKNYVGKSRRPLSGRSLLGGLALSGGSSGSTTTAVVAVAAANLKRHVALVVQSCCADECRKHIDVGSLRDHESLNGADRIAIMRLSLGCHAVCGQRSADRESESFTGHGNSAIHVWR